MTTLFMMLFFASLVLLVVFGIMWAEDTKHGRRNFLINILVSLVLFIVAGNLANNEQYEEDSIPDTKLEQLSSTNKNDIVDKNSNISYIYKTNKNAKITAKGINSSAKVVKLKDDKYKVIFTISDNSDYVDVYAKDKNKKRSKDEFQIFTQKGYDEDKKQNEEMNKETEREDYNDTMAKEIKNSVNENESIHANKVSVDGQFDSNPKTMSIYIRSNDFTGKHDEDYLSILDAIHESQKHDLSKFSNIKYVLVDKLTDGYHDSYEPIAWFNFTGKSLKGLKTNELTLDMLESIATDYHFKPLK